ncbi:transcription factor A, mitochondrial-like isoform X2 [Homarus americanus]|uniref:transcription factor A, mitochondrial-like isoform X2 n=1 Tax=Homarus americanus TaxID=6706 RepID=UPI001C487571|nr:transcription factor A, mitochondrial-like isoform X2 [Homarus americanus]
MAALARLLSAQCSSTRGVLLRHVDIPCVVLSAGKQTIAEQLGLPEPPKRPLAPHLRFMKHFLEENKRKLPKWSTQEIFVKTVQDWKTISPIEKGKWTSEYEREKTLYDIRYTDYMKKISPKQLESIRNLKKKRSEDKIKRQLRREKKKEVEELGKPKYPGNAFILYVSTLDRGEAASKDFVSGAARQWHLLPEERQNVFREKAKKKLEEYQRELAEWEAKMLKAGRVDLVRSSQLGPELKQDLQSRKHQH